MTETEQTGAVVTIFKMPDDEDLIYIDDRRVYYGSIGSLALLRLVLRELPKTFTDDISVVNEDGAKIVAAYHRIGPLADGVPHSLTVLKNVLEAGEERTAKPLTFEEELRERVEAMEKRTEEIQNDLAKIYRWRNSIGQSRLA